MWMWNWCTYFGLVVPLNSINLPCFCSVFSQWCKQPIWNGKGGRPLHVHCSVSSNSIFLHTHTITINRQVEKLLDGLDSNLMFQDFLHSRSSTFLIFPTLNRRALGRWIVLRRIMVGKAAAFGLCEQTARRTTAGEKRWDKEGQEYSWSKLVEVIDVLGETICSCFQMKLRSDSRRYYDFWVFVVFHCLPVCLIYRSLYFHHVGEIRCACDQVCFLGPWCANSFGWFRNQKIASWTLGFAYVPLLLFLPIHAQYPIPSWNSLRDSDMLQSHLLHMNKLEAKGI